MRNLFNITGILLCIGLSACATTDSRTDANAKLQTGDVAYIHHDSNFAFPRAIDDFRFDAVTKYDSKGHDVGIGYNSPTPIAATVYVYPGPENVAILPQPALGNVTDAIIGHELKRREDEVLKFHTDAVLLHEEPFVLKQGNNEYRGARAVFNFSYSFGLFSRKSLSELYIFVLEPKIIFLANSREYVEYRFSYPESQEFKAAGEVSSFLSKLTMPVK